jgi:hypothetical protein
MRSHCGTADHPPSAEASPMQELIEIDSSAAHSCANPRVERWHVYEPVSMQWLWLVAYLCCGQVVEEPENDEETQLERAA